MHPRSLPRSLIAWGAWLAPGLVWAAESQTSLDPTAAGYLGQLVGGLVLVVLAIVVLAWFMRRVPGLASPGLGAIQILAVRSIGARERLMLVQVGHEQILIGVTAAGVRHLHTLAQPIEPTADEPWTGDFASLLERFKRGGQPG
ncbi:flagellar biosynthetic protein FliO [Allochromatium palmeri]|uniref:Flagellar protein n=1 Tax=Allochromatium palmeri TaxID=231048 RepID=A0A6N8ECH7_9GAMM|nr:flagellar biosynthetic protein FliO [Allochromatium palmeri]MTW20326.1 flagellar biosynthetic protein FliO [Allochromatium palmeri]